jgi:ABC-type nitrate/sulfonate/bicarbonate transport system permease component
VTRSWWGRLLLQLVVPAALVALWWVTSAASSSYVYPPLADVLTSLREVWLAERIGSDVVPSLGRFAAGYVLAVTGGIGLGLLIGSSPSLRRATQPVTELVRAIPPPLLLPLAIVTIGIGNDSKIAVIALGSVWPVLLNTVDGVRSVDRELLDAARAFRLDRRHRITHVVVPSASPRIAVGMRTALAVALILMVISEMQGSTNGLGFRVLDAQRSFDSAGTYAGVLVIGGIGLVVNLAFLAVERRVLRWHRGARGLLEGAP